MGFGVGENEMCFIFGCAAPVEAQRYGVVLTEDTPCVSVNPHRDDSDFSLMTFLESIPEYTHTRIPVLDGYVERCS